MDFTAELSKLYNVTPFEIFKQDKDNVIMLINYFIEKGRNKGDGQGVASISNASEKEQDRQFWSAL
jgi:hypothetical protein